MEIDSARHSRLLIADSRRRSRLLLGLLLLLRPGAAANLLVRLVEHSFVRGDDNVVDTLIELADGVATDFGGQLRVEDASVDAELVEEQLESVREWNCGII